MKMSRAKCVGFSALSAFFALTLCAMSACTTTNDAVSVDPSEQVLKPSGGQTGEKGPDSDSSEVDVKDSSDTGSGDLDFELNDVLKDYAEFLNFKEIPSMAIKYGTIKYSVNAFFMTSTEVTQGLYKAVMDTLPKQDKQLESLPVVNVSWYDAVLFCNALSKMVGLDTAYVYKSVGDKNYLNNLKIDYSVESIRLPTETEWEIAAHGGVTARFYWDDMPASEYAYYGQSKGPAEVGSFKPNDYGLYDMAGNVAEWVNDWYDAYSTVDQVNPTGPETGASKCVRGGGWSNKVTEIAPKERDKKDPLYHAVTLGFRIVYSDGFK